MKGTVREIVRDRVKAQKETVTIKRDKDSEQDRDAHYNMITVNIQD